MIDDMLVRARIIDFDLAARTIEQRMAVEEFSRLDRLEEALAKARAHAHWPGVTTAASRR
jgi:hypothetical protein